MDIVSILFWCSELDNVVIFYYITNQESKGVDYD